MGILLNISLIRRFWELTLVKMQRHQDAKFRKSLCVVLNQIQTAFGLKQKITILLFSRNK